MARQTDMVFELLVEAISRLEEEIVYQGREARQVLSQLDYERWVHEKETAIQRMLSENGLTRERYERKLGQFA